MESIRTLVQIADRQHGHSSTMLTKAETLETVEENDGAWVMDRWSSQHNWLKPTGILWGPCASCLAWLAVCDRKPTVRRTYASLRWGSPSSGGEHQGCTQ